jgi:hypothetical protein
VRVRPRRNFAQFVRDLRREQHGYWIARFGTVEHQPVVFAQPRTPKRHGIGDGKSAPSHQVAQRMQPHSFVPNFQLVDRRQRKVISGAGSQHSLKLRGSKGQRGMLESFLPTILAIPRAGLPRSLSRVVLIHFCATQ